MFGRDTRPLLKAYMPLGAWVLSWEFFSFSLVGWQKSHKSKEKYFWGSRNRVFLGPEIFQV